MKNAQVALALAGGYLLGRLHKMRWALALAGVAAGKRLRADGLLPTGVLKSPEMERLAKDIRGELLSAGRTAAVAAVGTRINELSDRMGERAASLREPSDSAEGGDEGEEAPRRHKTPRSGSAKSGRVSRGRSRAEGSSKSSGTSTKPSSSGSRSRKAAREEGSGGRATGKSAAGGPSGRSRGR